jgi:NAD-dependent dihydropyrimidine dehydrogenase PreA subunit
LVTRILPIFAGLILNSKKMAYVISDDCTACGTCIDECPVEAISEGDIYKIDADICTDCGSCADVCPVEAIHPA